MTPSATISLAVSFGLGAVISALSARVRVPAVLALLIIGVGVGPWGLGLVDASTLGGRGGLLGAIVVLSIGLLVFEGGLHLDRNELARAPRAVIGLLTIGLLVTLLGAATIGVFVLDLPWPVALLLGSLLVVTGPTVVQPILRHIRLTPKLHSVLSAEAILIDPIGVVVAVLTMELVLVYYGGGLHGAWPHVANTLALPMGGGLVAGVVVGSVGALLIRLVTAPRHQKRGGGPLNVAVVGICMIAIAAGEFIAPDGGLVSATIAAVILSNTRAVATTDVRQFKEQVATLLVGMLFILLASTIDVSRLATLSQQHVIFIAALLFIVRPVSVLLSSAWSKLEGRQMVFAGLFAPRGIVAASVATLIAAQLSETLQGIPEYADSLLVSQVRDLSLIVFAVIGVSVLWVTVTAWPMGWALGVLAGPPRCVLIIGGHMLAREAGKALKAANTPVALMDSNARNCELASRDGLVVIQGDATDTERLAEVARLYDCGWIFAWTGNDDVDRIVGRWAERSFGPGRTLVGLPKPPEGLNVGTTFTIRTIERLLHEKQLRVVVGPLNKGDVRLLAINKGSPVADPTPPASGKDDSVSLNLTTTAAQVAADPKAPAVAPK